MMAMTCQECIDKLHPFLDRELTNAERAEVERHLEYCGECADAFQFESGILRTVERCCRSTYASESFKARIRVVVRSAIEERG